MRSTALALAAALMVAGAGGAWAAGKGPCMARAHKGAQPWEADQTGITMHPFRPQGGSGNPADNDAEVAGIDRDDHGAMWVTRIHEFTWRRQDVDLRGDCSRVGP